MVFHSTCPDAMILRLLTHRNAQVPALLHINVQWCLSQCEYSWEQSCYIHVHTFSGPMPRQESQYCVIWTSQFITIDLRPAQLACPSLPQDCRQRAGKLPVECGRRWYSQQTVTHAQIFHFWSWLKVVVSMLCEIGFPPHDFMQQLSAMNPHRAFDHLETSNTHLCD